MSYPILSSKEVEEGVAQLHESLPSDPDLIFRGTEGTKEVHEAMSIDRLGMSSVQKQKLPSTDIVDYIVSNESSCFFSASPCRYTVQNYAAGLPIIPCRGFIWVMGLPKIYTIPQKHLFFNEEMFTHYDRKQIEQSPQGYKHHSIKTTAANNNEFTIIVGIGKDDDWSLKVSEDVMKLVQVRGPGKILGKFMSADEILHVQDWTNPGFKKRVWSCEVVISQGSEMKDFEGMNQKARELGFIGTDDRLLTLKDASSIVDSEELEELNTNHSTSLTHRVMKVHKDIPLGNKKELVDCIAQEIRDTVKLEPVVPSDLPTLE
ncbi:hypothetical protein OQJ18_06705 [Fluoribacter dumoffii]|nr:hypothetical protein [Fluoribacter dumoffii]MCW8418219.1 hypothetical protein [Fluoribacter dumoffii]MCW8453939.1 hypothetical protein [Fluoribacter dumoffii]MCW8461990.1 hypothetical protein [Fluoribacter dumoffii]MCW8482202.1 hypothetical protein [Fluoribacter dumoffii]